MGMSGLDALVADVGCLAAIARRLFDWGCLRWTHLGPYPSYGGLSVHIFSSMLDLILVCQSIASVAYFGWL